MSFASPSAPNAASTPLTSPLPYSVAVRVATGRLSRRAVAVLGRPYPFFLGFRFLSARLNVASEAYQRSCSFSRFSVSPSTVRTCTFGTGGISDGGGRSSRPLPRSSDWRSLRRFPGVLG